ncbi:CCAAT/enhancer-binding protein alpha [Biomphalaria pfeifferi]|uniref:CCAAT/enhancer-binding protein alpha n=1 Tax=Biomphalaria pfeifferi TaxID=112525 RepID=A0AAD8C793_BIOPF|nr:CCAAT/enhancer-binding protein alpha [Biomphalaria pfeifferi]
MNSDSSCSSSGFNFHPKYMASGKEAMTDPAMYHRHTDLHDSSNYCTPMESLTATPQHKLPDVHQFTAQASGMQDMQGWPKPMAWPSEAEFPGFALTKTLSTLTATQPQRPRGEKKPIPEDQKDEKYFERRRRNNDAARRSRDSRKQREDNLATRASYLETTNNVLRARIMAVQEEIGHLKSRWVQKSQEQVVVNSQLQQVVVNSQLQQVVVNSQLQQDVVNSQLQLDVSQNYGNGPTPMLNVNQMHKLHIGSSNR